MSARTALSVVALTIVAVALGLTACGPEHTDACEEATFLLDRCGVSMPLLTDGPCAGFREVAAECVLENASTCREVADLHESMDQCAERFSEGSLEEQNVPPPPRPEGNVGELPDPAEEEADDAACSDGEDNDGDGLYDCDDSSCSQSSNVTVCPGI